MQQREVYIGPLFGDVEIDENGYLKSAKYVRMIFNLPINVSKVVMEAYSKAWIEEIEKAESPTVSIVYWTPWQYVKDASEVSKRTTR